MGNEPPKAAARVQALGSRPWGPRGRPGGGPEPPRGRPRPGARNRPGRDSGQELFLLTVSQKTPKTDRNKIPVIPGGGAGPGAGTAWRSWTPTGEPEPGGAKTPKTDRKKIPVIPVGGGKTGGSSPLQEGVGRWSVRGSAVPCGLGGVGGLRPRDPLLTSNIRYSHPSRAPFLLKEYKHGLNI